MISAIAAAGVEQQSSQEHIGAGPAMFRTLFRSQHNIESKDVAADGTVTLHAVQTV